MNRSVKGFVLAIFLVIFSSLIWQSNEISAADFIWERVSPTDTYTQSNVPPAYDIDFIVAKKWATDISNDYIYFYIYMRQPVTQYMFNDLAGSWLGLWIDNNKDGVDDIVMQIQNVSFPAGLYSSSIYFRSRSDIGTGKCGASTFADLAGQGRWIGIKFQKSCAGMYDDVLVDVQAEYISNSGRYDSLVDWNLVIPSSSTAVTTTTQATTTTTTTTTTTVPKPTAPTSPSGILVQQVSSNAIRIGWTDNSTNEDGFILQRDDQVVPLNTPYASWPMRTAAGVATFDIGGLEPGKRYCITVSAFNSGGNSNWAPWSCIEIASSQSPPEVASSLTCSGIRGKTAGVNVLVNINADKSNAGKLLNFEVFSKGTWKSIGSSRLRASGVATVRAPIALVGKAGSLPIRATQGSRFICEGSLT